MRLVIKLSHFAYAVLLSLAASHALAQPSGTFYLQGGTVISMVPGQRPFPATVMVRDGLIAGIGPQLKPPPQARVIDISGRYLLPGFVDMHAHVTFLNNPSNAANPGYDQQTSERILRDLLAYGVTTIRNPAAPPAEGVRLRDEIAAGQVLGPRVFTAGWPLNGNPSTTEAISGEVERQCTLKVDYLKVYARSTPPQTKAAIKAAHACGIKVIGHLEATDWPTAASLGINFFTHGVAWSPSTLPPGKREEYLALARAEGAMKARIFWLESVAVNGPEMDRVIDALVRNKISIDPTLVAYESKFLSLEKYRSAANIALAPPAMQASWRDGGPTADWSPDDFTRMQKVWPKMLAIIRRYHRAGVRLTTGSDLPNIFLVPGVSLHQEMELLVEAGIPPADVLAMSTRNAATALGHLNDSGTIEAGKRADLVVLNQNPLADIRNTRAIAFVVTAGRLFQPSYLLKSSLNP